MLSVFLFFWFLSDFRYSLGFRRTFLTCDHCLSTPDFDISSSVWILLTWNMSGSVRTCCVPKCGKTRSDNAVLHTFPHPEKDKARFLTWMNAVGQSISSLSHEYIFKNRRICSEHFQDRYKTWKDRLSNIAVPTLLMPGFQVHGSTVMRDITNLGASTSTGSTIQSHILDKSTAAGEPVEIFTELTASTSAPQPQTTLPSTSDSKKLKRKDASFMDDKKALKQMLKKATKKNKSYAERLKKALDLSENKTFQKLLSKLTTLAAIFITMQLREAGKKKTARRFSEKEKVMALSLYKNGPKLYRFMSKVFVLPSPITLSRLIARANFRAGINEKLLKVLKEKVKTMTPDDKLCVLLFDELAITPHFDYNSRKDDISGFVDTGITKERKLADHALVFMIRGIVRNYKQPIAYTFCSGSTKKDDLTTLIEQVIRMLHRIGLRVVATVCDQGASNVSAINNLIGKTKTNYLRQNKIFTREVFEVDGVEVIPLYDPPHLLKGIRNNLLSKILHCTIDGNKKIAKWEHLVLLHKEDPTYNGVRLLKKLTENHINPQKTKMKVKYATQVFSRRIAGTMGYFAKKNILPEECTQTADVLLFFDSLFDSVNGSEENAKKRKKVLLGAVTPDSIHKETWAKAKKILASMTFIKNGKEVKVPSIKNWIKTLNNLEYLRDVLFHKYEVKSIWMRHFNQDPLENFFGSIRSHGCRNVNPTPAGFEVAFASLLISNLTGTHSPGYNCADDSCTTMFKSMEELFKREKKDNRSHEIDLSYMSCDVYVDYNVKKASPQINAQLQYISGYLIKKTMQNVFLNCAACKNNFYSNQEYEYLQYREYNKNKRALHYPKEQFIQAYSYMQDLAKWVMQNHSDVLNLRHYLITIMHIEIDLNLINCEEHKKENVKYLFDLVSKFFIYNWCKNINNILQGRRREETSDDFIVKLAIDYVKKRKK